MRCRLILPAARALELLHLGTGWRYGEHLVFTMHLQTFSLMAMTVFVSGISNAAKATLFAAIALRILLRFA